MISLRKRFVSAVCSCRAQLHLVAPGDASANTIRKAAIKELIMERFDIFAQQNGVGVSPEQAAPPAETVNGHGPSDTSAAPAAPSSPAHSSSSQKRQADNDEASDSGNKTPPKKKRKAENDIDADALYAAKLQAEENMRARPTRGSAVRKAAPVKRKTKSKTSKKVKAEDDSDVESGSEAGAKKEVNRSGGFHVSRPEPFP